MQPKHITLTLGRNYIQFEGLDLTEAADGGNGQDHRDIAAGLWLDAAEKYIESRGYTPVVRLKRNKDHCSVTKLLDVEKSARLTADDERAALRDIDEADDAGWAAVTAYVEAQNARAEEVVE